MGLDQEISDAAVELAGDDCLIETPVECAEEEAELLGDKFEAGWAKRGARSSFRRNVEVWKILAQVAIKVVKARKIEGPEGVAARTKAAEFLRDGLLVLGPTFVKP